MNKLSVQLALILTVLCGVDEAYSASAVADSVADFSATQGTNGWLYGYYASPPSTGSFQLMTNFDSVAQVWWVDSNAYWTSINKTGGHPNGTTTSGGKTPVLQWNVRRWVSSVNGHVTISGCAHDSDAVAGGSDGVDFYIRVDGVTVWSGFVWPGDAIGLTYTVGANVTQGSHIDFVQSPAAQGNDWADSATFTGTIDLDSGFQVYGTGCPGVGGVIPGLIGTGDPSPNSSVAINLSNFASGAVAYIFLSAAPAAALVAGCPLLVAPSPLLAFLVTLDGNGTAIIAGAIPPNVPAGTEVYMQCFALDVAAANGVFSGSNGLFMRTH